MVFQEKMRLKTGRVGGQKTLMIKYYANLRWRRFFSYPQKRYN
jgi:hypothetical protein